MAKMSFNQFKRIVEKNNNFIVDGDMNNVFVICMCNIKCDEQDNPYLEIGYKDFMDKYDWQYTQVKNISIEGNDISFITINDDACIVNFVQQTFSIVNPESLIQ
jgi:hypothetical protein